jgi:putative transposase
MSRNISFETSEFYHIYNRGTEKRLIFLDENDQNRFLNLLFFANSSQAIELRKGRRRAGGEASGTYKDAFDLQKRGEGLVDLGAYCLMPNHFHLLVREKTGKGISEFIHKLSTSYSMYFNRRHKRTGALFEGPFKANHVTNDNHLNYLFAYIHLNPVKIVEPKWPETELTGIEQATEHLTNYPFSSYQDYLNLDRPEQAILNKAAFPDYFAQPKDFGTLIKDWMLYRAEERG